MKMKKIGPEERLNFTIRPLHLHDLTYMSVMVKQTVMEENNAVCSFHLKISGIYILHISFGHQYI